MVVRFLAKEEVEGSSPFSRSKICQSAVALIGIFGIGPKGEKPRGSLNEEVLLQKLLQ